MNDFVINELSNKLNNLFCVNGDIKQLEDYILEKTTKGEFREMCDNEYQNILNIISSIQKEIKL